ncbi:MAG: EI24 domain-containing protein [Proteobacteria bacterium]|nr:EI24 domain-containing protein [Pseudomonadota bacterium]
MRPLAAIGGAFGDILGGRLTLLAILNLVLAGAISGAGAVAAIHYLVPLIPHAAGWLGFLFDALRFIAGVGAWVLGIAISPAASMLIGGFLFDAAASRVEKAIGAPSPRKVGLAEGVWSGIRMATPTLLLNLLVLPLYVIPGINALVFVCINGYLMGRDFATTAAMRRMPFKDALKLRRSARFSVFVVGVACAVIPFLGPLVGASAMTRLVHSLR